VGPKLCGQNYIAISKIYPLIAEAEFLEIVWTEVTSKGFCSLPPLLEQKWFETGDVM
jgi:hypothetical protein